MIVDLNDPNSNIHESIKTLSDRLRSDIIKFMEEKGISKNDLAEKLNFLPISIDILLSRSDWTIEESIWLALKLGMKMKISVY